MRLWIDLTSSAQWSGPAVGIVRTEMQVATELLRVGDSRIRYCRYDAPTDRYVEIAAERVRQVMGSGQPKAAWPTAWSASRLFKAARRRLERHLPAMAIPLSDRHPFGAGDIYLSVGLDAYDKDLALLERIARNTGMQIVVTCYDIIPVRFPHLTTVADAQRVRRHFATLARLACRIMCISEHSRSDLRAFYDEEQLAAPQLERIRLGSSICSGAAGAPCENIPSVRDGYILFVSSLVSRKNHEVLYRAYRRLMEAGHHGEVPRMIWVGKVTKEAQALMHQVRVDPVVPGKIEILEDVDDDRLAQLYHDCLFTVYPSLCEGWGLPVAESAAFGKFCLASDIPSIREIAGDLHEYLDPWDVPSWTERLRLYFTNPQLIRQRNRQVAAAGLQYPWSESARQIIQIAERVGNQQVESRV